MLGFLEMNEGAKSNVGARVDALIAESPFDRCYSLIRLVF
jgi:hypothetical protein